MAAVESALVPLETSDTVDSVLAKIRATRSKSVQLLVPPDTAALQAPRGFERLRRALEADGVAVLVFSADEQVIAAARRNQIESIAIDSSRSPRPPLPPPERATRTLPETRLDPRDAAFIDALDQVPARDRYADTPDADLYAAIDDYADEGASDGPPGQRYDPARAGYTAERTTARASGARRAAARDYADDQEYAAPARRSPLLALAPIALLLLVAALAVAWFLANRTSVTVSPPASAAGDRPFQGEIIPLDPSGNGGGTAVQAAPVTADAEASASGSVQNETLSPSGTAKGEVTIRNVIESAVPLPKGSEFIAKNAKGEEVRFTIDNDVTVPGAVTSTSLAGRSTTYGQVNVAITARAPGSASNVGENTIATLLIPGQQPIVNQSSNFIFTNGPIGGGSEAPQRIVTEQDVQAVLGQALTALYNTGVQQLRSKIDESKFGIDATTIAPSSTELADPQSYDPLVVEPAIGQPVADPNNPVFKVTVRARFKGLATPRDASVTKQLETVAPAYFAQQSDRACKAGEQQGTRVDGIHWDGEKLTIDGAISCGSASGLSVETLAKVRGALRGQPREAAEAGLRTLQQQGLIGEYQLPDKASFPRFDFLIDVKTAP